MARMKWIPALVLTCWVATGPALAGDWREIQREQGMALGIETSGLIRSGDNLEVDFIVALLPERHLPIYAIMRLKVDCSTLAVVVGGSQYYLANGDPFGAKQADVPSETFEEDGLLTDLCDGVMPSGPGVDSANAFFQAVQIEDD